MEHEYFNSGGFGPTAPSDCGGLLKTGVTLGSLYSYLTGVCGGWAIALAVPCSYRNHKIEQKALGLRLFGLT